MRHPYMRTSRNSESLESMNARINWTDHEKETVAAEALKLHKSNPKLTPYAAVVQAQAVVLTPARQRPLHNTPPAKVEKWLMPLWDGMKKAARQANARANVESLFTGPVQPAADTPPADDAPAQAAADVSASEDNAEAVEPASEPETPAAVELANDSQNIEQAQSELNISAENIEPAAEVSKPHSARRQVHWKDDERKKVAARAYSNMKAWPDMSRLEAFRKAQESELTEDRRRHLVTWELIRDWAEPMLEALALDEKIEAARIAEENERKREEAKRQAEANAALAREREAAEQAQQLAFDRAVAERVNNLTFDELLSAMARRFGRIAYQGFSEGFSASPPPVEPPPAARFMPPSPPSRHDPAPPSNVDAERQRLPKVCIVGLMNQQENDVERAFLGVIKFVFVKSQRTGGSGGHGGAGMLDKAWNCDLVVSMADFTGHDVDEAAKKLKTMQIPFKRINGNSSALKRELRTWLDDRETRKAA